VTGEAARPRFLLGRLSPRQVWVLVPLAAAAWPATKPLADNSFLWHITAGKIQLAAGEVLRADPFSFTAGGEAWRTQSWLAELLYGFLINSRGTVAAWVQIFLYVMAVAILGLLSIAVYAKVKDPVRTGVVIAVVTFMTTFFLVPRPVIFSYALLAATAVILISQERLRWTLVPLFWLWAALHGSYAIGLGLVALEAIRVRSWPLFRVAVVAGVATAFTAHGLGAWEFQLDFLESRGALAFIVEWANPDFTNLFLAPFLFVVIGLVYSAMRGRIEPRDLWVIAPFLVLGLVQVRSVYPALLVLLPYAAAGLRRDESPVGVRGGSPVLNLAVLAVLVVLVVAAFDRGFKVNEGVLPPGEVRAALTDERVFAGAAVGGLLIFEEHPDRLVFVDDRAELYGEDRFEEVVDVIAGRGYREVFAEWDIAQAIVKPDWTLAERLADDGWTEEYRDDRWVVFHRP
jgi:hypothetical protein